jgi:hypothetical protein
MTARAVAGAVALSTLLVVLLVALGTLVGPDQQPGPRVTPTTYGYPPR